MAAVAIEDARRHHADDLKRHSVESNLLIEDGRHAAEALLPRGMAEDQHAVRARLIFLVAKSAAEDWRDAEDVEMIRRHPATLEPHRLAGNVCGGVDVGLAREHLERMQSPSQL